MSGQPAVYQIMALLLLMAGGALLMSLLAMGILFPFTGTLTDGFGNPHVLRFYQLFSSIGTFLLPALGVAWLCSNDPKRYLSLEGWPDLKIILLSLIGMLLLSPVVNLSDLLNRQIELPAFMAPIENWMREQEEAAEVITNLLLADNDILSLLSNLLVIALCAGITEEFFFRGALQRIIGRWIKNHHAVIWTAAILFSAFHMQFYGFFPRMFLGAYFGYLVYWSRNIWVPVIAHFFNNAITVVIMSSVSLKENEYLTGELDNSDILPYSLLAIASLILLHWVTKPIRAIRHLPES